MESEKKKYDRSVYDKRYSEKRRNKSVSFKTDSPIEARLLKIADGMPNFSDWVKGKLKELDRE